MEIIDRKKENELISTHTTLEPVIMMGLTGKDSNDLHNGHIHMASEIKSSYPDSKIIAKLFCDLPLVCKEAEYYHAIRDSNTGEKTQIQGNVTVNPNLLYDIQDMYNWIETNTVIDYVIKLGIDWFTPWIGEPDKVGTAAMLPSYNLDFNNLYKPFE